MSKIKKDIHRRLKHTSHTEEQVVGKVQFNELDSDMTGSRSLAVHGRLTMRTDSEVLGIKKKRKRKKRKERINEDPELVPTAEKDDLPSSTYSTSDGVPLDNAVCSSEKRDLIKFKVWRLLN